MKRCLILFVALALPACSVRDVAYVATTPVRVVGKTVDVLTTSQAEADRKRGKKVRKQEERDKKAAKRAKKDQKRAEKEAKGDY